jgi:sigma-B regulation protein RsbU (phosphoserine phosphatase)
MDAMTTAAIVAYYRKAGKATISYAGHPPVLYKHKDDKHWSYAKRKGSKEPSKAFALNIPLAVEQDARYEEVTIPLTAGDRLFVYTDGILDTPNSAGERFGTNRLKQVLDDAASAPLAGIKSAVINSLNQYAHAPLFHDDVTLIALESC